MLPSRKEIDEADVIIGVNEKTGAHTVFYGKGLLSPIANGYEGPRVCASATVSSVHRYAASGFNDGRGAGQGRIAPWSEPPSEASPEQTSGSPGSRPLLHV